MVLLGLTVCHPCLEAPVVAVAAAGVLGRLFAAGYLACLPTHCLPMDLGMAALGGALLLVLRVVRGGNTCPRWSRPCLGGIVLEMAC